MMVEKNENIVDLSFLDAKDENMKFTVLIILNRPLIKEFYLRIREISDFIMCADGAANRIYDIIDKNDQK
jgi:thiamine pyrophosphokinase